MSVDAVLHDDGSGSMTGSLHLERTVWELLLEIGQMDDVTFEELCEANADAMLETESPGSLDDGYEGAIELVVDDAGCDGTFTASWTAGHAERVLSGLGPDGGPLFQRNEDGWRFELDMGIVQEQFGFARNADLAALIVDQPTLTISVALPGEVHEHNADSRDGSTFHWHVVLTDTEGMPDTLYAGATPSGGSGLATLAAIIVAAAVLGGLVLVWLVRRRSSREADADFASPPHLED